MTETIVAAPLALSITWRDGTITETRIHWAKSVIESATLSDGAKQLKAALSRYVAGQAPNWPDLPYDFATLTDFQSSALQALARIPSGETRTYGQLAAELGSPNGARAIGRAMATNPFPLVYPCHRVVGAKGQMTGFSAEDGVRLKEFLLRHEGAI